MFLTRITERNSQSNLNIFGLLERFLGRTNAPDVVFSAINLLSNKIESLYPQSHIFINEHPELWKKLIDEWLKNYPRDITRRIMFVLIRLNRNELLKAVSYRKTEIFEKYCIFEQHDDLAANLIEFISALDDTIIEKGIQKGLLDVLAADLKKKTINRSTLISIISNIMCTREIYLDSILEHPIMKLIRAQVIRQRITGNGLILASSIIRSCKIANNEQIFKLMQDDILLKSIQSMKNIRYREQIAMSDLMIIYTKMLKLYKKTKSPSFFACTKSIYEVIQTTRIRELSVARFP